jgi:beta-glucosidase
VINVQFDVTNTGTVKGDEVALLFVSFPNVAKQLKGFVRVSGIDGGKKATATIPVRVSDLKYWDSGSNGWKYPSGEVKIMVGSSSADADLTLTDTVTIN